MWVPRWDLSAAQHVFRASGAFRVERPLLFPSRMRAKKILVGLIGIGLAACTTSEPSSVEQSSTGPGSIGWDVYFKRTYGNEVFLTQVFPTLPGGFQLGIDQVFSTPRSQRFDVWGVLNDPDCTDGDASTDGFDRCADPGATGVIGVRKTANPNYPAAGPKYLLGTACAVCHAGLSAEHPPADPNVLTWNNIDVMPGNQFIKVGKIFGAHLSPHDPRWQVFNSWPAGTLDTTAIWSDGINNPLRIAPITDFDKWPAFEVTNHGITLATQRQEHSGQDDLGCELRSLRVWMSEGMCGRECSLPARATNTPIDIDACRANCADFRQAESEVGELCKFMDGWHAPSLSSSPGGSNLVDGSKVNRGRDVFDANCAGCHSGELHSDFALRPFSDIGVNSCAARSSNWSAGRIWASFSSDTFKARALGQVRTIELTGVWSSAPLLHNNSVGVAATGVDSASRVAAFEASMRQLLDPSSRPNKISRTTDFTVLSATTTVPAGFDIWKFANADGLGGSRCADPIEDKGHAYGSDLSGSDQTALIEYLKTL
jgi:cytochrome c5